MSALIPWFASIGFAAAVFQVSLGIWRWLREPYFEVIQANFGLAGGEKLRSLGAGSMTVLTFGGSRPRRVVNWALMSGAAPGVKGGPWSGGGINKEIESVDLPLPPGG